MHHSSSKRRGRGVLVGSRTILMICSSVIVVLTITIGVNSNNDHES